MAVFKCKMCGGNLEVADGQNIGTCDSCGSTMTLPKANDERVVNLFNRATHYRQQNEFDKAIATYESILEEDSENAEAYLGLVLSKYGIEYVEDPKTHKRIPTCHRLQHTSITADLDYKSAIKYALDYDTERLYTEEATKIAEIQKNVLAVANNEEAYDIFICYKETDKSGKRTMDSVLAQDIYSQLTNEGYKVFFSRITLEDKLGQEYEPYIFSALNSAKVMLVVGTDKDNFNAVWVKNEWSRFLALSKKDKNKIIIPCYKDMDAYDLPDELSMFQSQDMNKIGFLQDLIRGIKKILETKKGTTKATVVQPVQTVRDYKAEAESMLKRAFLLLEEAEWSKANDLLEKVLNIEPENAKAYLGKLMAEVKVNKEENLAKRAVDFSTSANYQNALRFADSELKQKLEKYNIEATQLFNILEAEKLQKELEEKQRLDKEKEMALYREQRISTVKKQYNKKMGWFYVIAFIVGVISVLPAFYYHGPIPGIVFLSVFVFPILCVILIIVLFTRNKKLTNGLNENMDKAQCDECLKNNLIKTQKNSNKLIAAILIPVIVCTMLSFAIPRTIYNSAMELYEQGKYTEAAVKFESLGFYLESYTMKYKSYGGGK